jgi:hypothetical protein
VVGDHRLFVVVDEPEGLEGEGQFTDERMVQPLDAMALLLDVVRRPEPTELLALHGELAHEGGQTRIVGVAPRVHPQKTHHVGRLLIPLHEQLAILGLEKHHPRPVPLLRRHLRPVPEDGRGHPVPDEDLRPPPHDIRGHTVEGVDQLPQSDPHLLRPDRRLLLVLLRLREMREMRVLGPRQPQSARDRVEHLRGHVPPIALLKACVVRHGHSGQLRQLLAAQPGHPAMPPEVREPHVLRLQPGTARAQELAELGTPVQRPPGPLPRLSRPPRGLLRGLFIHTSSIHGRTHTNLPPSVVGPANVRKAVVWVTSRTRSRLEAVPGRKAGRAQNPSLGEPPA